MKNIGLKYSVLLILCLILMMPTAQSKNTDSLKQLLTGNSSTEETQNYIQLSNEYLTVSKELSLNYGHKAIMSATHSDNNYLADAFKCVGNVHYLMDNIDSAIYYNYKSLEIYQNSKDTTGQAKALNNLGIFFAEINNYPKAIQYHVNSLELKKIINDSSGIAYSCNNIGTIYFHLGQNPQAIEYFNDALRISKSLSDLKGENSANMNIGLVYLKTEQFNKAINFFKKSLKFCNVENDISCITMCYANIGDSYMHLGDYDNALNNLLKSININNSYSINNPFTLSKIGEIYEIKDDISKAIEYYMRSFEMVKLSEANELTFTLCIKLSRLYAKSHDWETAYEYLSLAQNYKQTKEYDDIIANPQPLQLNDTINNDIINKDTIVTINDSNIFVTALDKTSKTTILIIALSIISLLLGYLIFLIKAHKD